MTCTGADEINQAADAAEKVTSDVNQLVADLAQGSQDGDAVEDAYEQRSHACNPQTLHASVGSHWRWCTVCAVHHGKPLWPHQQSLVMHVGRMIPAWAEFNDANLLCSFKTPPT